MQLPALLMRVALMIASAIAAASFTGTAGAAAPATGIHIAFAHGASLRSAPNDRRVRMYGVIRVNGKAVPRTAMAVVVTPAGGTAVLVGTVKSDRHGSFRFTLPPGGTRTVAVGLGALSSNVLSIRESTHVRLTASPRQVRRGHRVQFVGQIVGLTGPPVLVELQVEKGRLAYQTFLVVRTRTDGSFRGRFRFAAGKARYRFRALVEHQAGFPFARSRSNLISVAVH